MCNAIKTMATLLLAVISSSAAASVRDVGQMVKNADDYRQGYLAAKVASQVSLFENGELDKTRQYHVYTRPNRESLVVFKSQVEAGQKMLMLGDNYWLLMPKSRRPIRITPMQKLLGEASVGDISTLTWSEDYQATLIEHSAETNQLRLKSVTKGASYERIDLWLDAETDFPLKADLYLRSGKLAKQAIFEQGQQDGRPRVVAMTLLDEIQPAKKTVIAYQQITSYELEEKYYNPAYLIRNLDSEL